MIRDLVLVVVAYLLGSIPFGVLVARAQGGVDLRRVGSGNIGATNVLRAVGKGAAALTLLGDIGKGAFAVAMGRWIGVTPPVLAAIALATVAGHLFPVFARFRGGKGVATTLGVVLAAMPAVGACLILIWLVVAVLWRYSSLAALAASAALPILVWVLDGRPAMLTLSGVLLALVVFRHRENIARLLHGTEGKIGQRLTTSNGQMVK
ncbi:MAG TPA: glycerol-3-phosphate 1-O-acyltransferase PlsY [Candidatus Methylomirabilis sp.]|nr:glycerol-3-phosphate 1-O-acyltransferase PlsY [Candidatus Methylomirabilis sp.]